MKYSALKLLRAQYSWNNDKVMLYVFIVASLLSALIYFYFGTITDNITGEVLVNSMSTYPELFFILWGTLLTWYLILYHSVKLTSLSLYCILLTYCVRRDEQEYKHRYGSYYMEAEMTNTDIDKVEPWLEDETSQYETSNIDLCVNKGCGFNKGSLCSAEGAICFGYMEEVHNE